MAFKLCSNFMPNERPTTDQLINILAQEPENQLILKSLAVSQSTALGNSDKQFASLNIKKSMAHSVQGPANDCSFLGLGICDKMLCEAVNRRVVNWDRILQISEDMIINLPLLLHGSRDVTLNYDVSEAHDILKSKNLLNFSYELSEEFVDGQKVFSDGERQSLIESLCEKAANKESSTLVGLYTCSPYTFVLRIHEQSYFWCNLGSNFDGNGILVVTKDCSLDSCKTLCQWIIKRLKCSGVVGTEYRSLVWLTILNGMLIVY